MRVEQQFAPTEGTESSGGEGESFEINADTNDTTEPVETANEQAEGEVEGETGKEEAEGTEESSAEREAEEEAFQESVTERRSADQARISAIKVELQETAPFAVEIKGAKTKNESKVEFTPCVACKGTGKRYLLFKCGVCKGTGSVPKSVSTSQTRY